MHDAWRVDQLQRAVDCPPQPEMDPCDEQREEEWLEIISEEDTHAWIQAFG